MLLQLSAYALYLFLAVLIIYICLNLSSTDKGMKFPGTEANDHTLKEKELPTPIYSANRHGAVK